MAKPLSFTFSSLDTFINCPLQFHHKYVLKDVKDEPGEAALYGTSVHEEFEKYINSSGAYELPKHLLPHKEKLDNLLAKDGVFWCEEKVAFNKRLQPCRYDDPDRMWRGNIDFRLVDPWEQSATVVDYKTGKVHDKWVQPALYAIHTFMLFPKVQIINAQYYWTKTGETTKKIWGRAEIEQLWLKFSGDLKQYTQAFKEDVWQPRPSGLCYGWCPVKTCSHWKPKKAR